MTLVRRLTAAFLVIVLAGCSGAATWTLDPGEVIGPDTTEFTAWVTRDLLDGGRKPPSEPPICLDPGAFCD